MESVERESNPEEMSSQVCGSAADSALPAGPESQDTGDIGRGNGGSAYSGDGNSGVDTVTRTLSLCKRA